MNDSTKRDEWDEHNRDEAQERAAQQEAAGPGHSPVPTEVYASSSGLPQARDADQDAAALLSEYECAAAAERTAWLAAREFVADGTGGEAWNTWRDAIERTQKAARALVNRDTGRSARS